MSTRSAVLVSGILLAFGAATASYAQDPATVGELLEKGGKKLSGDELTRIIAGSHMRGVSMTTGTPFEASYNNNGTLDGLFVGARGDGGSVRLWGKWAVNERSEVCIELNTGVQACTPYFELAGKHYQARSDSKTERVFLREIKR